VQYEIAISPLSTVCILSAEFTNKWVALTIAGWCPVHIGSQPISSIRWVVLHKVVQQHCSGEVGRFPISGVKFPRDSVHQIALKSVRFFRRVIQHITMAAERFRDGPFCAAWRYSCIDRQRASTDRRATETQRLRNRVDETRTLRTATRTGKCKTPAQTRRQR